MYTERDTYNLEYAHETLNILSIIIFDPLDIS